MNIGQVLVGAGAAALPAASTGLAGIGLAAAAAIARGAKPEAAGAAKTTGNGLAQTNAQRQAEQLGTLLSRLVRGNAVGSSATTTGTGSSSGTSGSLAFLKDSRLSVEEKLARLMVQLSDKYEKKLEQKLQQYADLEAGKGGSTSSAKKATGAGSTLAALGEGLTTLLSKAGLGKAASGPFLSKLVSQAAGPVLAGAATALGLPALAPLILKAGPLLGSLAGGALTGLTGAALTAGKGAAAKTSSTKTSSSTSTSASSSASSSTSAPSEKQLMTEIQILQEKQKEMFSLVSNVLRSMHDTKMAVIGNVR